MDLIHSALAQLDKAAADGKLSAAAVENIRAWLTQPYLSEYADQVAEHITAGRWAELDEAFWTTIPFGTGGRRGRMYPIGCNAINDRTIGESAQGLADYVKKQLALPEKMGTGTSRNRVVSEHSHQGSEPVPILPGTPRVPSVGPSCAIAYDTRHRSRHFAELCSEIMVAAGFTVYFLDGFRSTPELSFAVRHKHCDCGIMITASHNPPSDNAVKVYGPSGGQYVPPHDEDSIREMQQVTWIKRTPFADALADGKVVFCQEDVDAAFIKAVLAQSVPGPKAIKILYSPLHGVGASAVYPVLTEAGFRDVEIFGPHAQPNGDFPNVPKHVANPENAAVFDSMMEHARTNGAELILATDPDCDRLGCAVRKSGTVPSFAGTAGTDAQRWSALVAKLGLSPSVPATAAPWTTLTGNQLGSLLVDFLLGTRKAAGTLTGKNYVVKTLVTTELFRHIADHYGVETAGNLHVGFKWIGAEMDARGPKDFVFGAEESYGFLAGDHVRDKDGAVASLLTAELAAKLKTEGKTLYQRLDELFLQFGCFTEGQINVQMPGEKGMEDMRAVMARLRATPPSVLGGMKVAQVRDYLNNTLKKIPGAVETLGGPPGDLVMLDIESAGNYLAVRPSGTEPKLKIYLFAYDPPAASTDLEATKAAQAVRLNAMGADFRQFAGT